MLKIIVIFLIIGLLITTTLGLHAKIERKVTNWLELSRLLYFILLSASIVNVFLYFKSRFIINILWVVYLIIVYVLMETAFRLKRETFGNPHLTILLLIVLIGALGIGCWWI